MSVNKAYKDAGVDLDIANELVSMIKNNVEDNSSNGVLSGIGGFSSMFDLLSVGSYERPILTSSSDGVGTKLYIANEMNLHNTIGKDLVAMCVNDLIVTGSTPLFFLDYFSSSKIQLNILESVIQGIHNGCKEAGCVLVGGESAEMPGLYKQHDYDLAGFCVGVVDKKNIIDGSKIEPNDIIIGVESSGFHSNGYSLIRKILFDNKILYSDHIFKDCDKTIGEILLTPTNIYVKPVLDIVNNFPINGMVNITGGGFFDNIPRVVSKKLSSNIFFDNWDISPIFHWFKDISLLEWNDMLRIFNCGIGYIIICNEKYEYGIYDILKQYNLKGWNIGKIIERERDCVNIIY